MIKKHFSEPEVESHIDRLLAKLSIREKIGQLFQEKAECDDPEVLKEQIRQGQVGSLILASTPFAGNEKQISLGVEDLNELQRVAVEESPHGIPLIFGRDIIHGCRTVMPVPLGQACAWDRDLVRRCSESAAREAAARGVHWTFSPMIDISRDPRWGRVVEGYGEDPYLVGQLGVAAVEGYQGRSLQNMKAEQRIVACAKHFIGYGASEGGRDYDTTEITDHTLRNLYMPPYVDVLNAGCMTVMSSFNEINGEAPSGSHHLLTELLKGELGFEGFVVSDWAAIRELIAHGIAEDHAEAARIALHAGMDMEMVSPCFIQSIEALLAEEKVDVSRLDDAVRRILRVKYAYGLFADPYTAVQVDHLSIKDKERQIARETAAKTAVLLKNRDSTLPLSCGGEKTLLTGPLLDTQRSLLGTWSMDGEPADVCTYLEAFRSEWGEDAIVTHDPALFDLGLSIAHNHRANQIERIIVFIGEDASRGGEHYSVSDLSLPPGQVEYVEALAALGLPITAVVTAGRPLLIERVLRCCDAVLYSFHAGIEAGNGIYDALTGAVEPQGRLPMTFPRSTGQVPIYYNRKGTGRPWSNAYVDQLPTPLLPFGYGLSYTEFTCEALAVNQDTFAADDTIVIECDVSNVGQRSGAALIQFYAWDHVSSLARPKRFLCGFTRVPLIAGERTRVRYELPVQTLGFYNRQGQHIVEPGAFTLYAGFDSTCSQDVELIVS